MTYALETDAVSVRIGRKALLDSVTLSVAPGDTVAIVGPNGAGKSTLVRVLAGEIKPTTGRVTLKGRALASYAARALALHRAVLSQNIAVTFPFTVADIVRMGAGERHGAPVEALVSAALREVDLANEGDRIITTLSGGEQQRAHFARVLVQLACGEAAHGPGILLLDEPTASLDMRHQIDLISAARHCAARGVTVIAILHDLNLAAMFAGRIVVLDHGRIAADGPPSTTITDDLLRQVFRVDGAIGKIPPAGIPFVLPHVAMPHS